MCRKEDDGGCERGFVFYSVGRGGWRRVGGEWVAMAVTSHAVCDVAWRSCLWACGDGHHMSRRARVCLPPPSNLFMKITLLLDSCFDRTPLLSSIIHAVQTAGCAQHQLLWLVCMPVQPRTHQQLANPTLNHQNTCVHTHALASENRCCPHRMSRMGVLLDRKLQTSRDVQISYCVHTSSY